MTDKKPILTKRRAAELLELCRLEIAELQARQLEDGQKLHTLTSITAELWEGILNEDAPEFEIQAVARRAS